MLTSPRPLAVVAAVLVVAMAAAGCDGSFPGQARATGTQTLSEPLPPGDVRVAIEMFNGPIDVRAGDPGTITATVTTVGVGATSAEAEADRERIVVSLDVNPDGSVLLRAVYQPAPGSPNNRSASAVVEVPARASLDLRTSNGRVRTSDVEGAVDAWTSNGAVDLAGVAGAMVRTSNGAVDVDGSGLLDVETSNGRVAIRGSGATVRAVSSNADVSFEGTFSDSAQELRTSNNGITVRLPETAAFRLDARTSNGSVKVDGFDVRTTGAASDDTLQGTVGSGGPEVTLRTSNASIVVSAR